MNKAKSKNKNHIRIKSDLLFKSIMEDNIAAQEFLSKYLPKSILAISDLSKINIEKESYIEEDLKNKLSDIVYSVAVKGSQERSYLYVLLEHQSTIDKWIGFRLWKYTLLLLEKHKEKGKKLPLVVPMVFYNGKAKYNAERSFWGLFENKDLAKEIMGDSYILVDLESMSDEEIKENKHLGMVEFFMKHIRQRDMLKLWERFFREFKEVMMIDKERGYIYIKKIVWYTNSKIEEVNKARLNNLILDNLPKEEGEEIMRTIADGYYEKGLEKGLEQGLEQGIINVAKKMLEKKLDLEFISSITGLSIEELSKLKNF